MGISPFQFSQMLSTLERNRKQGRLADAEAPELECELAGEIRRYCDAQWPRWKVDVGRTDKKSTRPLGAHDMTVYFPPGRVLCLELKSKTGKRKDSQRAWAAEMGMCGHVVHEVRTFQQFLDLVSSQPAVPPASADAPLPPRQSDPQAPA